MKTTLSALVGALVLTACLVAVPSSQAATASARAQALWKLMTPTQRAGQLFMLGVPSTGLTTAERKALTSDFAGGVYLKTSTKVGVSGVAEVTKALNTTLNVKGAKPLIGVDQEGGAVLRLSGTGFAAMPNATTQGAWSTTLLRQRATTWGKALDQAGVSVDLAPVADVVPASIGTRNKPIGSTHREYGSTPAIAGPHVAAFVKGLQGSGVATTLKHFPGLGRATGNTDTQPRVSDPTTATDPYLKSFQNGIDAGADFVMVSSAIYPHIDSAHRACFSSKVMHLLRTTMGFKGIVISDSFGASSVASVPLAKRAVLFLKAGGTIVLDSSSAQLHGMLAGVVSTASQDPHFAAIEKAAVLKVLTYKITHGLTT